MNTREESIRDIVSQRTTAAKRQRSHAADARKTDLEQLKSEVTLAAKQVADQAATMQFPFAELVRPWWAHQGAPRTWRTTLGWRVAQCNRGLDNGTSREQDYWLLANGSVRPSPKQNASELRSIQAGLRSLRRRLRRAAEHDEPRVWTDLDADAVTAAWAPRDDARFRAEIERVLGRSAIEQWHLIAYPTPGTTQDGDERSMSTGVAQAVDAAFAAVDGRNDGPVERGNLRALLGAYLYFDILVAWEVSDAHERLKAMADTLVERTMPSAQDGEDSALVVAAVQHLAGAVPEQLRCETGLFCSCPIRLGEAAVNVITHLTTPDAQRTFERLGDLCSRPADLQFLAQVLCDEYEATLTYAKFQRDAAQIGDIFTEALLGRERGDTHARALLRCESTDAALAWARERTQRAVADLDQSVYASEVRPYVEGYARMADGLCRSSLIVDEGEVVLLYPFGLPGAKDAPHDLVWGLLASTEDERRLATTDALLARGFLGHDIAVYDHTTSTAFAPYDDDGHEATFGARIVFTDHRLMLETTAHTLMKDVDIEVRVGSYGNHCVRVAFSTGHTTVTTPFGEDRGGAPIRDPWTAHDIDQWVRRAGFEIGAERLWLEPRVDCTDDAAPEPRVYTQLIELVGAIVDELHEALAPDDNDREVNDLYANAQVMVVVRRASQLDSSDHLHPLQEVEHLHTLLGSAALLSPQRGLATTLEDWVRFDTEKPTNLLDASGRPGDLLTVNGDVTALVALSSPNWVTLETQDLIEFAVSAIGPLSAWAARLRHVTGRSTRSLSDALETNNAEQMLNESARIAGNLGHVRSLLARLQKAKLMRSHRDRDLLARITDALAIDQLEKNLDASIDAIVAQRSYSVAQAERVIDMRQKKGQQSLGWLLAFIGLTGLFSFFSWVSSEWGWRGPQHRWYDLLFLLVIAAVLVVVRSELASQTSKRIATVTLVAVAFAIVAPFLWWSDDDWGLRSAVFDVGFTLALVLVVAGVWWLARWRHAPSTADRRRRS